MADRTTSLDVAELSDAVGTPHGSVLPARVLVVRCEPSERSRVGALLGELGLGPDTVTFAGSLADARRKLVRSDPGCIVVDLSSSEPSDLETVAVLTAAAPGVPIVVMSAADAAAAALQALAVGADEHVEKEGLDAKSLGDALVRAVERRRAVASRLDRDELSAMLDSIDDPTCVVDGTGRIAAINRAWSAAAELADVEPSSVGLGVNYLTVCERAAGEFSEDAAEAAAGIRAVLMGETSRFVLDYPCPTNGLERWFALRVTPFGERGGGAVVVHRDITALKLAERRLRVGTEWVHRMLYEDNPVFALLDAQGFITHVSESTIQLLDRKESTLGLSAFAFVEPREREVAIESFRRVAAEPGAHERVFVHVVDGNGRVRELDLEIRNRLDDPLIGAISVAGRDITETRRHQIARHLESQLLHRLPAAVVVADERDAIVYWNAEASRLFGHPSGEVLGRPITGMDVWPTDVRGSGDGLALNAQRWEGEYDARRSDGTSIPVRTMLERVDDDEIDFHGVVGASIDISERRELEHDLAYRALHDPLTGLPNRHLFVDHLQRALARDARTGRHTAVLFADLDDFKLVNDRHGHSHGDAVLRSAAQQLAGVVRAGDVVARLGGDEFAVCCEDLADRSEAVAVAERMERALRRTPSTETTGLELLTTVSASIGVAIAGPNAQPEALLRHADIAMYGAKERGKSRVEVFDDDLRRRTRRGYEMATDLEGAVANGEIEVVYQPEYVLQTGELFGFEALARWTHPEWGPVAPGDFIRAAELNGSIGELGAQVLETACGVLSVWLSERGAGSLRMTVNVSAFQLADPSFPDVVRAALDKTGVPPSRLCLEITESALASAELAARALEQLKTLGVETSIDDFGTEYSSLSRLHEFPIDYLKIDRGFVNGMTNRPVDAAIIEALLGLARSLGIRAVAKGVEDEVQFTSLKMAGCELGQGFFWSKALPAEEAARLIHGQD